MISAPYLAITFFMALYMTGDFAQDYKRKYGKSLTAGLTFAAFLFCVVLWPIYLFNIFWNTIFTAMISELYIYDRDSSLFRTVLNLSPVMAGRYHISPNYGHDLNSDNLSAFLKDPISGLSGPAVKYPIAVLFPPKSRIVKLNGQRWEEFVFTLFFLTTAYQVNHQLNRLDRDTNTSAQQVWYDWEDMKNVANWFLDSLKATIRANNYSAGVPLRSVLNVEEDKAQIDRLTRLQNDKLNGVSLKFLIYAKTESCGEGAIAGELTIGQIAGRLVLMRFRVGAPGAPMDENSTVLQSPVLRDKKVVVFAGGILQPLDDGSGAIDFSDGVERHVIKIKEEDKITFYGGVAPREIVYVLEDN